MDRSGRFAVPDVRLGGPTQPERWPERVSPAEIVRMRVLGRLLRPEEVSSMLQLLLLLHVLKLGTHFLGGSNNTTNTEDTTISPLPCIWKRFPVGLLMNVC